MTVKTSIRVGSTYSRGETFVPPASDLPALIRILLASRDADGAPLEFVIRGEDVEDAQQQPQQAAA